MPVNHLLRHFGLPTQGPHTRNVHLLNQKSLLLCNGYAIRVPAASISRGHLDAVNIDMDWDSHPLPPMPRTLPCLPQSLKSDLSLSPPASRPPLQLVPLPCHNCPPPPIPRVPQSHLHCVSDLLHHTVRRIITQACIILDQHVAVVHLALRLAGHINLQDENMRHATRHGDGNTQRTHCQSACDRLLWLLCNDCWSIEWVLPIHT